MKVTLTQHPVGQGGMMSGMLQIPGGKLHWVYDCGSNQTEALKREIGHVASRGPVDCLFLSHLDSDHVNGIDFLLTQTSVTEVVLPYLTLHDRIVAVAHGLATDALGTTFLLFLQDIEGWFGERGVERVTFIMPRDDDDDSPPTEFPGGGGEGIGEGRIDWKWAGEPIESPGSSSASIDNDAAINAQYLTTGASLTVHASNWQLDWLLAPYAHRPSEANLKRFYTALRKRLKVRALDSRVLRRAMEDKGTRKILRECYDLIWSDHNLVSMALYAGPLQSSGWHGASTALWNKHWTWRHAHDSIGWLGTGDMHLNVGVRRKHFIAHYSSLLEQVGVFGLPHHGSHHNFHPELLLALPNAIECVAASGPNNYGHPHRS